MGNELAMFVLQAAPTTVTFYNTNAANAQVRDLATATDCSSTGLFGAAGEDGINITCIGNAATVAGYNLAVHWMVEVDPS